MDVGAPKRSWRRRRNADLFSTAAAAAAAANFRRQTHRAMALTADMESRRRTCNPSWSRVKESIYDNDRQTDVRPAARRWRRTLVVVPATYSSLHNSSRGAIAARSRPDQLYPCRSNQCPSTTSCIIHRTVRSDPPCATYAYPSAAAELPRHPESQPSPEVAPTDLATLSPVSVKFVRPMIYTSNLTCTR